MKDVSCAFQVKIKGFFYPGETDSTHFCLLMQTKTTGHAYMFFQNAE